MDDHRIPNLAATSPSKGDPGGGSVIIRSAQDVAAVVAEHGGGVARKGSLMVVILALGGIFMDAYDFSSLAFGVTQVKEQFELDGLLTGLVNASIMVGAVVGAISGGYLTDKFGRYRLFMADMVFFVLAAIGSALAPEVWTLIGFRFVMGLGVGLDIPVAMAFIAEFSAVYGRGNRTERIDMWSPVWYLATGIGYVVVLVFYLLLPDQLMGGLWRFVVGFGAIPALLILLVRKRYMSESPGWLANQGDLEGACKILRSKYGVAASVAPDATAGRRHGRRAGLWSFTVLFSPQYRERTLVTLAVCVLSTLGYNAVAYGTPLIISTLFEQGMMTTISSALVINIVFGVGGGLIAVWTVSRFGARRLTVLGFAVQGVSVIVLAIVGIPSNGLIAISVAMLALFVCFQALGPGANQLAYATLSYPTDIRGIGVGFNEGMLRLFSAISLTLFPVLSAAMGTNVFWIIAIPPLLGAACVFASSWDPMGKDADAEQAALTTPAG